MNNDYIALLDSGIGGISLLKVLTNEFPNEKFLYFGDNKNAPYGNRTETELLSIIINNIEYAKTFGVKAVVLACNTLSITLRDKIEYYSGLKTFGVYPPVETAILSGGKTLVLCTPLTASKLKNTNDLFILPLKNLASDIEKHAFDLSKVDVSRNINWAIANSNLDLNTESLTGQFDTIILGCTHYSLIKNKIFNHFEPKNIFCGEKFTVNKLKAYIKNNKSLVKIKENSPLFIGDYALFNKEFYYKVVKTL